MWQRQTAQQIPSNKEYQAALLNLNHEASKAKWPRRSRMTTLRDLPEDVFSYYVQLRRQLPELTFLNRRKSRGEEKDDV